MDQLWKVLQMLKTLEVSAAYARLTLQSGYLPVEELLDGTGLESAYLMSADYIDWQILARMFHNIEKTGAFPAAWPAHLGGQFSASAHGSLGFATLSAPTLGVAMETLVEFYPSRVSALDMTLEHVDGHYKISLLDITGDSEFARCLAPIVLKVAESLMTAILGHPVGENVVIGLSRPAPGEAQAFFAAYDARLEFVAQSNCMVVPESWWRLPSPLYDESSYRSNIAKCRDLIASRQSQNSTAVIVRTHLRNHFDRRSDSRIWRRSCSCSQRNRDRHREKQHRSHVERKPHPRQRASARPAV